jgi:hypothetical protein
MNILELVDINIPVTPQDVDFYTVDPETLSFVRFGDNIISGKNNGRAFPLYVITSSNIAELTISAQSSSNIKAKIKEGSGIISDFSMISNNNTLSLVNVLQNTPTKISLYLEVLSHEWGEGSVDLVWSY